MPTTDRTRTSARERLGRHRAASATRTAPEHRHDAEPLSAPHDAYPRPPPPSPPARRAMTQDACTMSAKVQRDARLAGGRRRLPAGDAASPRHRLPSSPACFVRWMERASWCTEHTFDSPERQAGSLNGQQGILGSAHRSRRVAYRTTSGALRLRRSPNWVCRYWWPADLVDRSIRDLSQAGRTI